MENVIICHKINFYGHPMMYIALKKEYSKLNEMVVLLRRGYL